MQKGHQEYEEYKEGDTNNPQQEGETQEGEEVEEEVEQMEVIPGRDVKTNWTDSVDTFEELNLQPDLLRGIFGYGYEQPSQIQQQGILPIIKGKDTIAQA